METVDVGDMEGNADNVIDPLVQALAVDERLLVGENDDDSDGDNVAVLETLIVVESEFDVVTVDVGKLVEVVDIVPQTVVVALAD